LQHKTTRMKKIAAFALVLGCLPLASHSQDHKIQSLFVYNFAKYIEWPADLQKGDFIVGVVGDDAAFNQFKATLDGRSKGNQKISVQNLSNGGNAKQCHIVFVTSAKMSQMEKVRQEVSGLPIVFITEKEGALKNGSTINMVQKNGKMGFEVADLQKIPQLKFSSEILRLAKS
jgi:hypothetical protein